jgi:hypothetical protein
MEACEEVESGTLEAGGRPEASRPDSLVREDSTLPPGVYLEKHTYFFVWILGVGASSSVDVMISAELAAVDLSGLSDSYASFGLTRQSSE